MNVFKELDLIFPCGASRVAGEVVSLTLYASMNDKPEKVTVVSCKRKAWYVNASVNAWHLHRNLCRELRESPLAPEVGDWKSVRKLIRLLVLSCYVENWELDTQYYAFTLVMQNTGAGTSVTASRIKDPDSVG